MIPNKHDLARAGFLYTGEGDKTTCFRCGVGVFNWERTDDVWKEHKKWSPNCDYLKMVGGHEGINVTDTSRDCGGFGQVKTSVPSDKIGRGTFGLPKPQTPTAMDIDDQPTVKTTPGFHFGSAPKTDSNLFVYKY